KAIVDTKKHLHPSGEAILGYYAKGGRLLVVGAGSYKVDARKLGDPREAPARYAKGNEYLPTAARPPEGIPTIIATIATLTRYLDDGASRWLDINLANFSDLDEHFSEGIGWAFTQVALPHLRRVDPRLVARFITDQVVGTRIMKTSPYGITVDELRT